MKRPPRATKARVLDPETGKWIARGSEVEGDKKTSADSSPKEKKSKMKGRTRGSTNPAKGKGKGSGKAPKKSESTSSSKTRNKPHEEAVDDSDECSKDKSPPAKKNRSSSPAARTTSRMDDSNVPSPPETVAEGDAKGMDIISSHSK